MVYVRRMLVLSSETLTQEVMGLARGRQILLHSAEFLRDKRKVLLDSGNIKLKPL